MKEALEYILKAIVENPDKVAVAESEEEGSTVFSITVDPSDIGKVIGKEGKVIRAIRNCLKIPAIKNGKRIQVVLAQE